MSPRKVRKWQKLFVSKGTSTRITSIVKHQMKIFCRKIRSRLHVFGKTIITKKKKKKIDLQKKQTKLLYIIQTHRLHVKHVIVKWVIFNQTKKSSWKWGVLIFVWWVNLIFCNLNRKPWLNIGYLFFISLTTIIIKVSPDIRGNHKVRDNVCHCTLYIGTSVHPQKFNWLSWW